MNQYGVCVICQRDPDKKEYINNIIAQYKNQGPPATGKPPDTIASSGKSSRSLEPARKVKEVKDMASKECITEGCTSPVQKEGLCYKCYKLKHGRPPYGSASSGKGKRRTKKAKKVARKAAKRERKLAAASAGNGRSLSQVVDFFTDSVIDVKQTYDAIKVISEKTGIPVTIRPDIAEAMESINGV
jgi:hypothetical protein